MALSYGFTIIEGLPGSGKSYYATRVLLNKVMRERRPVYTNLPVVKKTLRHYLKRKLGPQYVGLYQPLTEEHCRAFMRRSHEYAKVKADWTAARRSAGLNFFPEARFNALFQRTELQHPDAYSKHEPGDDLVRPHGPNIITGQAANWIPPGAVIIIDEAHEWFPATGAKEDNDLANWARMIRHHQQHCYALTQQRMQIALTFRRLAEEYITVHSLRDSTFYGPIQFKHLGVTAGFVRYVCWSRPAIDAYERLGVASKEFPPKWITLDYLPLRPHIFRLYNSFTHLGSIRQQRRDLDKIRNETGVPLDPVKPRNRQQGPNTMFARFFKRWFIRTTCAAMIVGAFLLGYVTNQASTNPEQPNTQTTTTKPINEANTDVQTTIPKLDAVGTTWARINGQRIQHGQTIEGYQLLQTIPEHRSALLAGPERVYLLVQGQQHQDLGSRYEFLLAIRDAERSRLLRASEAPPALSADQPDAPN